ncbi:MAG: esterase [Acidobacteria bacterium OLB17]|nr:MAG: esterase [Acidobacteria bacterium OLB17]MCZ2391662.1 esterase family protein [Acidobacteriota bacterium]
MRLRRISTLLALAVVFSASLAAARTSVHAQEALPVSEYKLASKLMAREMPYRVMLPAEYERAKAERFPVIYMLHGLYGHYTNWTDKTKIAAYAAKYRFIIVMPEGADGWYVDSAAAPNENYESYIVKELIPEVDKKFRTEAGRSGRFVAGLSMGGYGALKFALKYPTMFAMAGSFSGAFGTSEFTAKAGGEIGKKVDAVFGPLGSETRRSNDVFTLLDSVAEPNSLPFVYLSCGTEDPLFASNRKVDELLLKKKIPHEYREHPGGHDWAFWDDQAREFLAAADRFLAARKN